MSGSGSLEQKLRDGRGKSAKATVLTATAGIPWKSYVQLAGTDMRKHRYALSVEPEGEEPFEAKIVIRAHELGFVRVDGLKPGKTVWVLYDPDDHSKVAFDTTVSWEHFDHRVPDPGSKIAQLKLKELEDLRDRGAITAAQFEAMKARLPSG